MTARFPPQICWAKPGKGHHIAFNVLNVGRFKLGVACVGGARHALGHMIRYAKERKRLRQAHRRVRPDSAQNLRLGHAPLCRRKHGLPHGGHDRREPGAAAAGAGSAHPRETQKRIEEYAVECSILKVYGSEMLTLVADELVATMGGYGYVEEYPGRALSTATRASTASSKAPTKSTGSSLPAG